MTKNDGSTRGRTSYRSITYFSTKCLGRLLHLLARQADVMSTTHGTLQSLANDQQLLTDFALILPKSFSDYTSAPESSFSLLPFLIYYSTVPSASHQA